MGPNLVTCVLVEGETQKRHTHREVYHVLLETEIGLQLPQGTAKDSQQQPEVRKDKEKFSLKTFRESMAQF